MNNRSTIGYRFKPMTMKNEYQRMVALSKEILDGSATQGSIELAVTKLSAEAPSVLRGNPTSWPYVLADALMARHDLVGEVNLSHREGGERIEKPISIQAFCDCCLSCAGRVPGSGNIFSVCSPTRASGVKPVNIPLGCPEGFDQGNRDPHTLELIVDGLNSEN